MKVILLDNIKGVGKKDEVINAWKALVDNFDTALELVQEGNN